LTGAGLPQCLGSSPEQDDRSIRSATNHDRSTNQPLDGIRGETNRAFMDSEDNARRLRRRSVKLGVGSVIFGLAALLLILALIFVILALVAAQID
jgi:hypothetical protein